LLGVAAVALVIGVISLFGGGDDNPPSANSTSQQPASTAPSTEPGTSAPETTTASPAIPTIVAPTTTTEPPVTQPPAGEPPVAKVPVRVYNNSTIAGLAARASDDVKRSGWEVAETGNYSQGQIPTTTVYYRPGTNEEASAKQLATALQARVEARFDGIQSANAGIIVIVTNDYRGAATGTK
jgi:hypothetical protein